MSISVTKNNTFSLLDKFIRFLGIAGIGWLIDFSIYCGLFFIFHIPVFWANISGAIPAVTFVFFVSVRKIFVRKGSNIPLWVKYAIYVCYTIVLLLIVSALGQWGYDIVMHYELFTVFRAYAAILIKCGITGLTMICNFFMLKFLAEAI